MPIIDSVLSLIAPHHCLICQKEGSLCCQNCLVYLREKLSEKSCYNCQQKQDLDYGICRNCRSHQSLDGVFWYADYKNQYAANIIKALKFNNVHQAASVIAQSLKRCLPEDVLENLDMISAIPTANKRVRQRGWDQAKLISSGFSKQIKKPNKSLLIRTSSFDQIGATKAQRAHASQSFFKPIRLSLIRNSTIILVDDVLTTGSTLNSAAKTLKSAGAKQVYAITFARQGLKRDKRS